MSASGALVIIYPWEKKKQTTPQNQKQQQQQNTPRGLQALAGGGRTPPPLFCSSLRLGTTSCWTENPCGGGGDVPHPSLSPIAPSIHALPPLGREIDAFLCLLETDLCIPAELAIDSPCLSPIFHTSFVKRTVITLEESLEGECAN